MHGTRCFRIERKFKLLVPVKKKTRVGKRHRDRARHAMTATSSVRRNFVRDHALLHVFAFAIQDAPSA